jgi:hypothetical protein
MSQKASEPQRPNTRAKNANQRPGLIVLETQQKRRNAGEMAKVRAQEHLDMTLTEQHIHAALKNVARIQDKQHLEDIEVTHPRQAPSLRRNEMPSLRRHETVLQPRHVVPSMANDAIEIETEANTDDEDDPLAGDGDTERDDMYYGDDADENDPEDIAEEDGEGRTCPKKKKKGEGIRSLIDSLRKNPHPAGEMSSHLNINLVNKAPPIPTPKGKGKQPRARPMCVSFTSHPKNISLTLPTSFASPTLYHLIDPFLTTSTIIGGIISPYDPLPLGNYPFLPSPQSHWHSHTIGCPPHHKV